MPISTRRTTATGVVPHSCRWKALDGGELPLHLAAWGGSLITVQVIQLACTDSSFASCASSERERMQRRVFLWQVLLKAQADPHLIDHDGSTCLHMAASQGHVEVDLIGGSCFS